MAGRLPSTPPVLPGFTHVHILGTGGFADVFLYEQNLPRRPVAVKVMLADLVDDRVRSMFRSEVNLMGRLSAHPNILTVYQASVSADGRPYLVMELCSTQIGDRFRSEPFELDEALDIAIRIGGALETAHRAGTLHRDVKPANIMTTAYGHPVLSDFGIAGSMTGEGGDTFGVSVPWSAPEVLRDDTPGTVASEVWAFGATLYSLIVGRSPAEVPGGRNGSKELTARIIGHELQPPPADAPRSLHRVLRRALAKSPGDRYANVLAMVEDLQAVQREMGVAVTAVDLAEQPWMREPSAAGAAVDVDEADLAIRARPKRRRVPVRGARQVDISYTSTQAADPPRKKGLTGVVVGLATAVVLGLLAAAAVALSSIDSRIPVIDEVVAEPTPGGIEFSWDDPGLVERDSYLIRTDSGESVVQRSSTFSVTAEPGQQVCVSVAVNRDARSGDATQSCAEAG